MKSSNFQSTMSNLTAISNSSIATLTASANKSASAGLLGQNQSPTICINQNIESASPSNLYIYNHSKEASTSNDSSFLDNKLCHQIGTNLSDLSVCWHKMDNVESCESCGKPFYEGLIIFQMKIFFSTSLSP